MQQNTYSKKNLKQLGDDLADREVEKLMPIIQDAKSLISLGDDVDKSPPSISKYTSKKNGLSYSYQLDKKSI